MIIMLILINFFFWFLFQLFVFVFSFLLFSRDVLHGDAYDISTTDGEYGVRRTLA